MIHRASSTAFQPLPDGARGVCASAGRVVFGWFTDHMGITALTMFQCSTSVTGLSTALVPLVVDSSAIYAYSVLFGLFAGAFIALMPVFVAEELSPQAVRRGMSVIYTVQTPSGAQCGGGPLCLPPPGADARTSATQSCSDRPPQVPSQI